MNLARNKMLSNLCQGTFLAFVLVLLNLQTILVGVPKLKTGLVRGELFENTPETPPEEEYVDDENRLCTNVDIRNNLDRMHLIENCTVITGFLQIVLIEKVPPSEFQKHKYEKLREITGYVLLFRVFNLTSLRGMFPNLAVIRGQELIRNYALIFYDMPNLQEIGLKNLIAIQHGFIYTQHVPVLCHTDTIDWASIVYGINKTQDLNRFEKPAIVCNKSEVCRGCDGPYCWTSKSCQRFYYGSSGKITCHDQCLGGCTNRTNAGCLVCRGPKDKNLCVEKCPDGKMLFHNTMRCISRARCIDRGGLIFQGECVEECPAGFSATPADELEANLTSHTCYPCPGRCPKVCGSTQVMFLADAERLEGCTIINGTLQIRMMQDHPNLIEELRASLGAIEEIMGYLKVYRSTTLASLDFLENLEVIHGDYELGHGSYAIMVYENRNLQRLWDFSTKRLIRLLKGSMYFINNALLCNSQITWLKKIAEYNDTDDFINTGSNGYLRACNSVSLNAKVDVLTSRNVTLKWTRYKPAADQHLVGYVIYYTKSNKERSPLDDLEVCSEYGWQSKMILSNETKTEKHFLAYNLTGLQPATRYAFYVKTETVSLKDHLMDNKVGQSSVLYFKTKISKPNPPLWLRTISKTDNSITFSWRILKAEVEIVNRYHVDVFVQPDNQAMLERRNYCLYPPAMEEETSTDGKCSIENCCSEDDLQMDVPDIAESDDDEVYFRRKREVSSSSYSTTVDIPSDGFQEKMYSFLREPSSDDSGIDRSRRKRETEELVNRIAFYDFFADRKDFTVNNLLPYTYYTFQLFACSAPEPKFCSPYSIFSDRTEPSLTACAISNVTTEKNKDALKVRFHEPEIANGLVVAFNIQLRSFTDPSESHISYCITRQEHDHAGHQYTFRNLSQGDYGIRVQGVCLGGPGQFSDWFFARMVDEVETYPIVPVDNSLRNGFIIFGVLFCFAVSGIFGYVMFHKFKLHHDDKDILVENDANELTGEDGFVDCDLR
ncbi:insulin-like growth factor 1 receptor [Uranotaenia lowii]|uniref:insulin-like growth factor 1 receptor n=1 Tax=Uranotaenia lowii TaxID=190385 RepID=UPI00247B110A|nr:insulin-like growth factor 1 receptor [Uranotaenia lowii]